MRCPISSGVCVMLMSTSPSKIHSSPQSYVKANAARSGSCAMRLLSATSVCRKEICKRLPSLPPLQGKRQGAHDMAQFSVTEPESLQSALSEATQTPRRCCRSSRIRQAISDSKDLYGHNATDISTATETEPHQPSRSSRSSRVRQAISDSAIYDHVASDMQMTRRLSEGMEPARNRAVYSEARSLHHRRSSFQERASFVRECFVNDVEMPTLWQLTQCRTSMQDCFEDVRTATRTVSHADHVLGTLHANVQHRSEMLRKFRQLIWKHMPKLLEISAMFKTEERWTQLLQSTQQADEAKSEEWDTEALWSAGFDSAGLEVFHGSDPCI